MVENHKTKHVKTNLNYFSEELTTELSSILHTLFNVELDDIEAQKVGRYIAEFVLLKETAGQF